MKEVSQGRALALSPFISFFSQLVFQTDMKLEAFLFSQTNFVNKCDCCSKIPFDCNANGDPSGRPLHLLTRPQETLHEYKTPLNQKHVWAMGKWIPGN